MYLFLYFLQEIILDIFTSRADFEGFERVSHRSERQNRLGEAWIWGDAPADKERSSRKNSAALTRFRNAADGDREW
jgi:hypothetical protein